LLLLSPPELNFASKRSGAQEYPAPSIALLSKRSKMAKICWREKYDPLPTRAGDLDRSAQAGARPLPAVTRRCRSRRRKLEK
jgi:hypothetical protein